jgi:hypothetical protein
VFFDAQRPESLTQALERFEQRGFSPLACREQAESFGTHLFWQRLSAQLERLPIRLSR